MLIERMFHLEDQHHMQMFLFMIWFHMLFLALAKSMKLARNVNTNIMIWLHMLLVTQSESMRI
jgi:hypothetical protein